MSGALPPTPREERLAVIKGVAKRHGVTTRQIMSDCKMLEVVEARWAAMRLIQVLFGDSISRISRLFKRDRASVRHALRMLEGRS